MKIRNDLLHSYLHLRRFQYALLNSRGITVSATHHKNSLNQYSLKSWLLAEY